MQLLKRFCGSREIKRLSDLIDKLEKFSISEIQENHRQIVNDLIPFVDSLKAEDLGINRLLKNPNLFDLHSARKEWLYYPIAENKKFTVAVFALPKGTSLPIHNHPEMSVIFKCVLGELKVESCSVDESAASSQLPSKPWLMSSDIVHVTPLVTTSYTHTSAPSIVSNIHTISALSDSAFLDIVLPPYDDVRPVSYFQRIDEQTLRECRNPSWNKSVQMFWPEA